MTPSHIIDHTDNSRGVTRRFALAGASGLLASLALPRMAVAQTTPIEDLFARWLAVRNREIHGVSEEELQRGHQEYCSLQVRICEAEPKSARDVAIHVWTDMDDGMNEMSDDLFARIGDLAFGRRA